MTSALLQARVVAKIKECIALAEAHYGRKFKMPTISYDLRGGAAGRAIFRKWHIQMHPGYLLNADTQENMINNTGPHEMAHLIDFAVYPETKETDIQWTHRGYRRTKRELHGPTWREVMAVIGVPYQDITRCHDYGRLEDARRKAGTETVVCIECDREYTLGAKRVARLRAAPKSMWCKCKGFLKFKSDDQPVAVKPARSVVPTYTANPLVDMMNLINGTNATEMKPAPVAGASKIDKCWELYKRNVHLSRGAIIQTFISSAGCTTAGAGTYYATCKKRYESGQM